MADHSHPGPELLAYLDGELPPEKARRVEAHLATCAACRDELAALRRMQAGLHTTLDAALSQARLSRDADRRIRGVIHEQLERRERRGWRAGIAWLSQLLRGAPLLQFSQAALALVLVLFSVSAYRILSVPVAAPSQETLVFGDTRLAPGGEAALRVIVRAPSPTTLGHAPGSGGESGLWPALLGAAAAVSLRVEPAEATWAPSAATGAPVANVEVTVSLLSESGLSHVLYTGATDAYGTADVRFAVPDWPEGQAQLVIEASSTAGEARLVRSVTLARSYKVYLMSDKPAYRPGQTVYLRALVLDAQTLQPVAGDAPGVRLSLLDGAGREVGAGAISLSEYGVGVWSVAIPEAAAEATYTARAEIGDTRTDKALMVSDYVLPPFRVSLETGRSYYAPGEVVTGTVTAETFYGVPVAGGQVLLRVNGIDSAQLDLRGDTDADGVFRFAFDLGGSAGALSLEAEVVDTAGRAAGIRAQVPVSRQAIRVQAMPESGVLKPGVENVVYILASYPDGAPADVALDIVADGEAYALETGPYGLAVLRLTPKGATTLDVTARDAAGLVSQGAVSLAADTAPARLLLHAERAAYRAGETLVATALVAGGDAPYVYLDVARAGQLVATLAAPVEAGRAIFALDLDPAMVGALELRAYGLLVGDARIEDTRLVVVDPAQGLDVAITPDRADYAPGDTAHLAFAVERAGVAGAPVSALVGISIVDASVFALETLPPSFARAYFLASEQMLARRDRVAGLDLPDLVEAAAAGDVATRAQDVAARAAWAGADVADRELRATALLAPRDTTVPARRAMARGLSAGLGALPVLLLAVVVRRLRVTGLSGHVVRRMVWGGLALLVLMPVMVMGLVVGWLLPMLGAALFFVLGAIAVALLGVILAHGWTRRDGRLQVVGALLVGYLVLAGWLLVLAGRGDDLGAPAMALIVSAFLLLVLGVALQGQGLVLEGRRGVGWATTVLALVLVLLAVTAPAVPALRSELAAAVGQPALYAGPLGWLTGCMAAPQATMEAPTAAPAEVEKPVEVEDEPGEMPLPTPSPLATMALPTEEPLPVPAEPYPLRQIFPETLVWDPEAETDAGGRLALDVPLADTVTAWRVTALASTLNGEIGAGSAQLVVKQDLVLEVGALDEVRAGEAVTLTLSVYNLQADPETVRWELPPDAGYATLRAPEPLTAAAASGASATWVIRPARAGTLELVIGALGERSGDRVQVSLDVLPER